MKTSKEENSKISAIFNSLKRKYASVEKSDCFISSIERIYRQSRDKHRKTSTAASLFDVIDPSLLNRVLSAFCVNVHVNRYATLASVTIYAALKTIAKSIIRNDISYLNELDFACKFYSDTLKEAEETDSLQSLQRYI